MSTVWPLTGRRQELQFIDAALRRKNASRGVVLSGVAGVGKTRLAREAMSAAIRRGAVVRWVPATASARALPLGAFTAVVNVTGQDPALPVQRAATALTDGTGNARVVVAVDDAHLLDDLSAMLVHHLVVRRAAAVVLTLRNNEPAPDAITALWKDGYLDRFEVQPLSQPETVGLIESVLDGPVDSVTARRFFTLARGSALYLRQLIDGGLESGRLRLVAGVWRWDGPFAVSQSLSELVESRMGSLSEPVREVVDLLTFGEPLPVSVLVALTDPIAVEQAEARGVVAIVTAEDGQVQARLAHPLYGDVRRLRMGRLPAAAVCRRLAHALADADRHDTTDVLRRAMLTLDANATLGIEGDGDPALFTTASNRALELCDSNLAVRLARPAVTAGGGFGPHFLLLYAMTLSDRGEEAEREAAALASQATNEYETVVVAVVRAANLFWKLGRTHEAESTLDAVDALAARIGARPELNALRAPFAADLGRHTEAIDAATDALSSPTLSDPSTITAAWGMVLGLGLVGRVDRSGRRSIGPPPRLPTPRTAGFCFCPSSLPSHIAIPRGIPSRRRNHRPRAA